MITQEFTYFQTFRLWSESSSVIFISKISLNIMELNWIFIKCIIKLSNCNRIFIKFIIKLRNCNWVFTYMWLNYKLHVTAFNFSYPKRKIIPITSFRISRETYAECWTLCNWKLKKNFINLLKSNWIFWNSVLISRGSRNF